MEQRSWHRRYRNLDRQVNGMASMTQCSTLSAAAACSRHEASRVRRISMARNVSEHALSSIDRHLPPPPPPLLPLQSQQCRPPTRTTPYARLSCRLLEDEAAAAACRTVPHGCDLRY